MPKGILVFGANGCGKSTLGRALADILNYQYMDIENYYFEKSDSNPYGTPRSYEEYTALMLEDIKKHESFVLSAVTGDFGEKINKQYDYAVYMQAPLSIRLVRIKKRSYAQFGERALKGGDLFEQEQKFLQFAATRSLTKIEQWAEKLTCPIIFINGEKAINENIGKILLHIKR